MVRAAVAQPQTLSGAHPRRRLYRQPPVAHPRRDPRAVQGLKRRQHQNRRGLGQGAPDGDAWLDLRRLQQSIGLDHLAEAFGVAAGLVRAGGLDGLAERRLQRLAVGALQQAQQGQGGGPLGGVDPGGGGGHASMLG